MGYMKMIKFDIYIWWCRDEYFVFCVLHVTEISDVFERFGVSVCTFAIWWDCDRDILSCGKCSITERGRKSKTEKIEFESLLRLCQSTSDSRDYHCSVWISTNWDFHEVYWSTPIMPHYIWTNLGSHEARSNRWNNINKIQIRSTKEFNWRKMETLMLDQKPKRGPRQLRIIGMCWNYLVDFECWVICWIVVADCRIIVECRWVGNL